MEFYPDNIYSNNHTNWWAPTLTCLCHMVRAAGFPDARGWPLRQEAATVQQARSFVHGLKPGTSIQAHPIA